MPACLPRCLPGPDQRPQPRDEPGPRDRRRLPGLPGPRSLSRHSDDRIITARYPLTRSTLPRDPAAGTPEVTRTMSTAQDAPPLDLSRIAQDLQLRKVQVEAAVQLLDEGNTPPFIARYRKERAGGLDEDRLRIIRDRVG